MKIRHPLALAGLVIILSACQVNEDNSATSEMSSPLEPERVSQVLDEPDCQNDNCAQIKVDYLRFSNDALLSTELEQRLFSLAGDTTTLDDFAQSFFGEARDVRAEYPHIAPYNAQLTAKIVADHDDLLVIELGGYIFTGGAHGLPFTRYMVIDQRTRRVVGLDDMLIDGQHQAFNTALAQAHGRWLEDIGQDETFAENWPLSPNDNAAPMNDDMVVKYDVYYIAPYALGQPELHIPYNELEGILEPRYLPSGD